MTRRQVAEMLGISESAVNKIHQRNRERLDLPVFSGMDKLSTPGGYQKTHLYSFKGVLEVCRYSNSPIANEVIDKVWELADRVRKGDFSNVLTIERARWDEKVDQLEDELFLLRQQVAGLRNGHGSFSIYDIAQQLFKNGIGNGNVHKTIKMMVDQGLLQKDTSIKKRGLFRPFLKDIRAGYFDHELTNNGQPVPVWQSQITITAKGLDWIVQTFLSLRNRKWEKERPMIRYTRETQRRIAGLSPEVGGAILVGDPHGMKDVWID